MKCLTIVRHAKSDWGDPSLPDEARPLNRRGERDAPRMAAHVRDAGVSVDLVLHSPQNEFFVVRDGREYVGTISVRQLRRVILDRDWLDQLIIAGDMADITYPSLGPEDKLDLAMKLFAQEHIEELPVLAEGKVVGVGAMA